jgi:hypothetical protein
VRVTIESDNHIFEIWRSDAAVDLTQLYVREHVNAWLLLECIHELAKLMDNDDLQRVADAGKRALRETP